MIQYIIVFSYVVIALANLFSAIFIYQFVKDTVPRIQNMDRAMRVIKYDILKRRSDNIKKLAEGNRIRENIKDEDSFKKS